MYRNISILIIVEIRRIRSTLHKDLRAFPFVYRAQLAMYLSAREKLLAQVVDTNEIHILCPVPLGLPR
jgi:hypothetical protein